MPDEEQPNMGQPKVSVIVPAYRKPQYLPECLRSVQGQTFREWECIVVSDGSPRVEEIRAAVAGMGDRRFRLVELPENRGPAAARNAAIQEARADLLVCVDEDDLIRHDCLEILMQHRAAHGALIVCPEGRYFAGRDGKREASVPKLPEILLRQPALVAGSLIHRDVFQIAGFFDEHPLLRLGREDHEFLIRVVRSKAPVAIREEELYYIRRADTDTGEYESLDYSAYRDEYALYRYITRKHHDVYRQWPEYRRRVLRKAWLREHEYYALRGRRMAALYRRWRAAGASGMGRDFKTALWETMECTLGRMITEKLSGWRRRSLTEGAEDGE